MTALIHYAATWASHHTACGLKNHDPVIVTVVRNGDVVNCPECARIMTGGSVGPEVAAALEDPTIQGATMTTTPEPAIVAHVYLAELNHAAYDKNAARLKFQVVGRGEQNKTWAAATPFGSIELTVKNPAAAALFDRDDLGAEYEVTIRRLPGTTP